MTISVAVTKTNTAAAAIIEFMRILTLISPFETMANPDSRSARLSDA
jgi:hypothetical protein